MRQAMKAAAVIIFVALLAAKHYELRQVQPLQEKVGQMLMVGFRGTEAPKDSYIAKTIQDLNLGGVILFDYDLPSKSAGRNITDPEQTKNLVTQLKSYFKDAPLFVSVDAEGGFVNRLKSKMGFIDVPSAKTVGAADETLVLKTYWDLAKELADLGFNVNFAPVVDVDINSQNPAIGGLERSFSADPKKVVNNARTLIAAHKSFGVLTALKHFPGHGSSAADSHLGLADVTDTYKKTELAPYEELIKDKAVDAVMTAHIINRNVDPAYPATLSPLFIQNILRDKLGFDGVVFSDDMQMGAIIENYGFEDAIIRAINAGCDILVFSNNGASYDESVPYRSRDTIVKAVQDGRITQARIDQAYTRIMELKAKIK
jgi:beta-N-acetylhexosaminidase